MKKLTRLLLTPIIALAAQASSAAMLTFEDVPGGSIEAEDSTKNSYGRVGTYNGFNFTNTLYWFDVVGSASNYGAKSGSFALSNQESGTGLIVESSTSDFTFGGLWAKKWATPPESNGADSLLGSISGYKDNNMIWEISTGLNGSYKYFGAQAGLIDQLRLGFGNYFLVDDLELNAAVVPVPAAAWLFGSGLIALLGFARRTSRA